MSKKIEEIDNDNKELKNQLVYKYRPKTLNEMVLDDNIRTYFKNMVESKSLTNMTLIGSPGFGKTTLALCLANELNGIVHFVKCAIDGRVEYISSTLKPFCDSMSIDGRPKIVILDELDSASSTQQSSFQKSLRSLIESAQDTVFICTANYNNIIGAVLSRCPPIKITFSPKDLLTRVKQILEQEQIDYDGESLKDFFKVVVKKLYPDIRSILNYLQACIATGKLIVTKSAVVESNEQNVFMEELVDEISKNCKKPIEIRKFYIANKEKISDYQVFSSELYNYVLNNNIVVDFNTIMRMSDIAFQMNQAIDKEIQFYNLIITIANYIVKTNPEQITKQ